MKKSHAARLEKLDKLACIKDKNSPPVFVHWLGHPWTEEEKMKVIREHPDQRMFWKPLSKTKYPLKAVTFFDVHPKTEIFHFFHHPLTSFVRGHRGSQRRA